MATETPTTPEDEEHRDARELVVDMETYLITADALLTAAGELTAPARDIPQKVGNSLHLLVTDTHAAVEEVRDLWRQLHEAMKEEAAS